MARTFRSDREHRLSRGFAKDVAAARFVPEGNPRVLEQDPRGLNVAGHVSILFSKITGAEISSQYNEGTETFSGQKEQIIICGTGEDKFVVLNSSKNQ